MDEKAPVAGFIDVGTNSIHMLVVRFLPGTLGTPIYQDKENVRMGQSLYSYGAIDTEALEKTGLVLKQFTEVARGMGARDIVAVATCAAREAENRGELLKEARACGINLRIIPGIEEARLIRLGVLGPNCPERTLLMDIGGGSTEVAVAEGRENLYLDSLSLGAIRLAYGSGIDQHKPVTARQYDALRRQVDTQSYRTVGRVRELGFTRAVGSSGTLMALAAVCAARRTDGDASYLRYDELTVLMKDLCSRTLAARAKVPKLSVSRADIIIGGGAVAEELMALLGIDLIEISPKGLREGLQADYLAVHGGTSVDVRGSAVRTLAARCGCDTKHSAAVRRYALALFDALKLQGVLTLGDSWRELLGYAADLHDAGEFISYERHSVHSYTIIINAALAGFDSQELQEMALMARFHHNSLPGPNSKNFTGMDQADITAVRQCGLLLKIADILDRSRNGAVTGLAVSVSAGSAVLRLTSVKDISMQMWKLKTVRDDFNAVFGLRLREVHELV
ncbi:MAG: Ppx/GppA phosphatase family protein [Candidatus Methanomethylophilus sp.]|nr:Ppx/GppA phosphatase family protein [Methanomethylophilus sp.]MDD3232765.1 Ppx/GppA phosphatase family protein [Methanomethylophilus sp.]MDD4221813.1 Ppx/GppA phosphatase family protein [Methanomethylophilus sp.]MDD4668609.1 Ppx/GppA phosphatase family protein [Methanomethylophilus sp.]